jgi:pyruvate dehydrogenase E2 component (dihydrolipoamide acetyltransferase)
MASRIFTSKLNPMVRKCTPIFG